MRYKLVRKKHIKEVCKNRIEKSAFRYNDWTTLLQYPQYMVAYSMLRKSSSFLHDNRELWEGITFDYDYCKK